MHAPDEIRAFYDRCQAEGISDGEFTALLGAWSSLSYGPFGIRSPEDEAKLRERLTALGFPPAQLGNRVEALLDRIEAAIRLLYPDDMTPNAKRTLDSIVEDERESLVSVNDLAVALSRQRVAQEALITEAPDDADVTVPTAVDDDSGDLR